MKNHTLTLTIFFFLFVILKSNGQGVYIVPNNTSFTQNTEISSDKIELKGVITIEGGTTLYLDCDILTLSADVEFKESNPSNKTKVEIYYNKLNNGTFSIKPNLGTNAVFIFKKK